MANHSPRCVSGFIPSFRPKRLAGSSSGSDDELEEEESLLMGKSSSYTPSCCTASSPDRNTVDHTNNMNNHNTIQTLNCLTKSQERRYQDRRIQELAYKTRTELLMMSPTTSPEQRQQELNEIISHHTGSPSSRSRKSSSSSRCSLTRSSRSQPVDLDELYDQDDEDHSSDGFVSVATAGYHDHDMDDDSVDLGLHSRIISRNEVVRSSSPGALRLTRDGLKRHERKQTSRAANRTSNTTSTTRIAGDPYQADELEAYDSFKRQQHFNKYQRQMLQNLSQPKLIEEEEFRDVQHSTDRSPILQSLRLRSSPTRRFFPNKKQKDEDSTIANLSTAPLQMLDKDILECPISPSKPKRNPIKLFSKSSSPSALGILEQERAREREYQVQQKQERQQELQRFARRKQQALAKQRKLHGSPQRSQTKEPQLHAPRLSSRWQQERIVWDSHSVSTATTHASTRSGAKSSSRRYLRLQMNDDTTSDDDDDCNSTGTGGSTSYQENGGGVEVVILND